MSIRAMVCMIVVSCCPSLAGAQEALIYQGPVPAPGPDLGATFVEDEVVVEFTADIADQLDATPEALRMQSGLAPLDTVAAAHAVQRVAKQFNGATRQKAARNGLPDLSGYYLVRFDPTRARLDDVVAAYERLAEVVHVERIGIHPLSITPNDGNYPSQWHLNQANDRDIDAPEAWNIETGDPSIVVAVLDTGVRYFHRDLGGANASITNLLGTDGNMWLNVAEKNGAAGVDDDGNGFVDDWVGWDFVTGVSGCSTGEDCSTTDNDPRDFNGHGTHCAGNVAAINNNGYATASPSGGWGNGTLQPTANGAKVMAMRIGWSQPTGGFVRMDFAAQAFYYAADNGARVTSCSWGSSNSGGVGAAVTYFVAAGGIVMKAAGNANSQTADYLCARSDVYCVSATDQNDVKASFSSYGSWVDISAPGVSILSSYHSSGDPNNDYVASISGTSMATPLVAGACAAVWSRNPGWTAAQVWTQVRDTTDNINAQNPGFVGLLGSGRLNLFNAVNTAGGCQNNSECDDGDPCNGVETCVGGNCQPGTPPDADGDGTPDCSDGCPADPNKTAPGQCGCGTPDTDSDGDGVADCNDGCPTDPNKTAPGVCGCGVPETACTSDAVILMVFTGNTSVPGVGTVANEDIVAFDTTTSTWSLYFDGSDVGLASFSIDALARLPNGDLLISVNSDGTLAGLTGGPNGTSVDDSDIVRFVPTSLGANTSGTWVFYFDGSDVGLTTNSEDVDALSVLADGRLLISTTSNPSVPGLSGLSDEDLIVFTPTSLGSVTSGTWAYYFDGSDVGLSSTSENTDACALETSGALLLSTTGSFSVPGLSGADEDVFRFTPTTLGTATSGAFSAYLDLTAIGIAGSAGLGAAEIVD